MLERDMERKKITFLLCLILLILVSALAGCAGPEKKRVQDSMTLHILFDYNKAIIKEQAYSELKQGINFVKRYPGSRIEIAGHTDNIGTPQYNEILSGKRAEAVREYLIREGGADPAKISSVGYRDLYPVAPNQKPDGQDNPDGRAQNRRVEINILSD
jgi:outer membrane protein OmpA-like peptidoglycan-associated protein